MLQSAVQTKLNWPRCAVLATAGWLSCFIDVPAVAQDAGLIALVQTEYVSLQDFTDRLAQLESALAGKNDARAPFAAMYVVLTRNANDLIQSGGFDDGEWVASFMVAFGNLYRQAFYDYEFGNIGAVPESWRITFDAAATDEISVFQHALLGIHTHINRDMPFAIADVTPGPDRFLRFRDFVRTNDFIVASIDAVEDAVASYDSDLHVLDEQLGRSDEQLLERTLSMWRFRAWRTAAALNKAPDAWPYRFTSAYLDFAAGRRARYFRDGDAVIALGNASAADGISLGPQRAKRLTGGHADPVLVQLRDGRVLKIDLN